MQYVDGQRTYVRTDKFSFQHTSVGLAHAHSTRLTYLLYMAKVMLLMDICPCGSVFMGAYTDLIN